MEFTEEQKSLICLSLANSICTWTKLALNFKDSELGEGFDRQVEQANEIIEMLS